MRIRILDQMDVFEAKEIRFEVLPGDFEQILALFEDRKVDPHPARWQVLGQISMTTRWGREYEINLFLPQSEPGAFKIGSTYYRRASNTKIFDTLMKASKNRTETQ